MGQTALAGLEVLAHPSAGAVGAFTVQEGPRLGDYGRALDRFVH